MGDSGGDLASRDYAAYLRKQAAIVRGLADDQRGIAADFGRLTLFGDESATMQRESLRAAQGLDQIAALHADHAIAYDDMIAAGGPDNSRAWVEYEATLLRHNALFPGRETFGR